MQDKGQFYEFEVFKKAVSANGIKEFIAFSAAFRACDGIHL
jgi:hypothetical protein